MPAPHSRGGPGPAAGPIEVLEISYGEFPSITRLNPSFVAGLRRLKMTVRIVAAEGRPRPGDLAEALYGFLPSLSFHRCCGENTLSQTFFERGRRRLCALETPDEGVDVAHLVEHVMIDSQHFIARMKACSGVTCAWSAPPDLYDIFVECPEEPLGRLCAGLAVDLVNALHGAQRPDPRYLCLLHVARLARDRGGRPLAPHLSSLEAAWGRKVIAESVTSLHRRGFLTEIAAAFNFSGLPLLTYSA